MKIVADSAFDSARAQLTEGQMTVLQVGRRRRSTRCMQERKADQKLINEYRMWASSVGLDLESDDSRDSSSVSVSDGDGERPSGSKGEQQGGKGGQGEQPISRARSAGREPLRWRTAYCGICAVPLWSPSDECWCASCTPAASSAAAAAAGASAASCTPAASSVTPV